MATNRKEYFKNYKRKDKDYFKTYNKGEERAAYLKAYHAAYRKTHKADRAAQSLEYYKANKEAINAKYNEKIKNDPLFKLKESIRASIRQSIKKQGYTKNSRTYIVLGCSFEDFKVYIESKWEDWMTWDNYGKYQKDKYKIGWDLDHIVPSSSATCEADIIKLNHYTNFQPLCSKVNRDIKKDRVWEINPIP